MQVALTGGTGFIGRALLRRLLEQGHTVRLAGRRRPPDLDAPVAFSHWDVLAGGPPAEFLEGAEAVIHMAGEPVAQRWTAKAKARIRASRVEATRQLVQALAETAQRPRTLVCASAIGIYGARGDEWLSEDSPPGRGFLAELAQAWEMEARAAEAWGLRVVRLRIGVVLGPDGGALARMLPVFRLGLGGKLGSGRQWMSWIHLHDLIELILWAVGETRLCGAVNATAPNPVSNAEFTRVLAQVLRRPAIMRVPAFALRMALGEMASVLLDSQRVRPEAALVARFQFRWPELGPALGDLLRRV